MTKHVWSRRSLDYFLSNIALWPVFYTSMLRRKCALTNIARLAQNYYWRSPKPEMRGTEIFIICMLRDIFANLVRNSSVWMRCIQSFGSLNINDQNDTVAEKSVKAQNPRTIFEVVMLGRRCSMLKIDCATALNDSWHWSKPYLRTINSIFFPFL